MAPRIAPIYRPKRKQERSGPVIASAVEAVALRLLDEDESVIRIPEICEATGVNYGSVYHHFGSREGLIDAAYVKLFEETAREDADKLLAIAQQATSQKQFLKGMREVLRESVANADRRKRRQVRVRVLAAALVRPDLKDAISAIQDDVTSVLAEMCTIAQDKGWFHKNVDPRAMAVMFQVVVIGRVLDDISHTPLTEDQWGPAVAYALSAFVAK